MRTPLFNLVLLLGAWAPLACHSSVATDHDLFLPAAEIGTLTECQDRAHGILDGENLLSPIQHRHLSKENGLPSSYTPELVTLPEPHLSTQLRPHRRRLFP